MAGKLFTKRVDGGDRSTAGRLSNDSHGAAGCILLAVLTACSHTPDNSIDHSGVQATQPAPEAAQRQNSAIRRGVVLDALGQIGRPYLYGGKRPDTGFDCSGLVQYVFGLNGVHLPRTSRKQYKAGKKIDLDDATAGDLLFYSFGGSRVDHVAIYLGDGQAVHAPSTGKNVIVAPVGNKWWKNRFVDAVRVLE